MGTIAQLVHYRRRNGMTIARYFQGKGELSVGVIPTRNAKYVRSPLAPRQPQRAEKTDLLAIVYFLA